MTPKTRLLAALAAAILLALGLTLFPVTPSRAAETNPENVLRLHILANSDSEADQRVKLAVRDAVLTLMPASADRSEAEAWLRQNGRLLLDTAERVLRENGFPYGVQLLLGASLFPQRSYDGVCFPAGEYFALRMILGQGAGHNWWCVLFPPLCIVTKDAEPLPAAEDIQFESTLMTWWRGIRRRS